MPAREYTFENFRFDGDTRRLFKRGETVEMEPKNFDVLLYLVEHPGRLVWKEELLDAVWPLEKRGEGRLKVCINAIRNVFDDNHDNPRFIRTVSGEGYWFVAQVKREESREDDSGWVPRSPGAPYEKGWYVDRGVEVGCLARFQHQWSPLAIQGPHQSGKRSLLVHLLSEQRRLDSRFQIVRLDVSKFPEQCMRSIDAFVIEMARRILCEFRVPDVGTMVEQSFGRSGSTQANMNRLMSTRILTWANRIILSIERAETLRSHAFSHEFFAMLRAWVQAPEDVWSRLRIICTLSTEPGRLESTDTSSFFNIAIPTLVENFTKEQVRKLSDCHRLTLPQDELRFVWELLHGQPFLTRLLLYSAVEGGRRPSDMVAVGRGEFGPFSPYLQGLRRKLAALGLFDQVRALANSSSSELSEDDYCNLYEEGLVVQDAGKVRLRCSLYEAYFQRR